MGWAVVVCAALFTAPSWYQSLVEHAAPVQPAFERFLVALPVAWALLLIVVGAMRPARGEEAQREDSQQAAQQAKAAQTQTIQPQSDHSQSGQPVLQGLAQAITTIENNPVP